jgi:cold shock CspA family protein
MVMTRHVGTVARYDAGDSFGFLRMGDTEIFVHRNAVVGKHHLVIGSRVTFDTAVDHKGRTVARNVEETPPGGGS